MPNILLILLRLLWDSNHSTSHVLTSAECATTGPESFLGNDFREWIKIKELSGAEKVVQSSSILLSSLISSSCNFTC